LNVLAEAVVPVTVNSCKLGRECLIAIVAQMGVQREGACKSNQYAHEDPSRTKAWRRDEGYFEAEMEGEDLAVTP